MNRYADLGEPQAVLDFHDFERPTNTDVNRETRAFVQRARDRGLQRVRIVTGTGAHRGRRPVVRPQVLRTLRRLEADGAIASWQPEKVGRGGEGAFFVRL